MFETPERNFHYHVGLLQNGALKYKQTITSESKATEDETSTLSTDPLVGDRRVRRMALSLSSWRRHPLTTPQGNPSRAPASTGASNGAITDARGEWGPPNFSNECKGNGPIIHQTSEAVAQSFYNRRSPQNQHFANTVCVCWRPRQPSC